jgi:hypothetical protein
MVAGLGHRHGRWHCEKARSSVDTVLVDLIEDRMTLFMLRADVWTFHVSCFTILRFS